MGNPPVNDLGVEQLVVANDYQATARGSMGRNCTEGCASPPDLINWSQCGDGRLQAAASSTILISAAVFSGWNHTELHCLPSAAGFEQGREKQAALKLSGGHLITVLLTWVSSKNFSILSLTFHL